MAKIVLSDIKSGFQSTAELNNNFAAISAAFENTVSRDGTVPNSMAADFDMDGNNILNVNALQVQTFTLNGSPIDMAAVQTVSDNIDSVVTVDANIADVNTVAANIASVNTVFSVAPEVTIVASIQGEVVQVAGMEADITNIASISDEITFIYENFDTVEDAAAAKADAEAAAALAERWASEAEDVVVEAGKFSAFHWAQKALDVVTGFIDDAVTSLTKTWSSQKIQGELDGKVGLTGTTGSAILPAGTDGQRDVAPAAGYLRFNLDEEQFEGYNGTEWGEIGGGGGAVNDLFYENAQTVTESYTIASDRNAMTTGPIEIEEGVVVTVETGARWVVL